VDDRRQDPKVSSVRGLYMRFRHLIHEGSKFLVIGAIGTIITFVVANALHGIGRYKAVTVATILATVFTYLGNRYWTFKHREGQGTTRDTIVFFVLNGFGLLIYYGCIGLTDLAGLGKSKLWYNVALVVGTGLGTLFRFWSYRKWVWVAPDARVLESGERPEELAEDFAAVVGAAPLTHHDDMTRSPASRPDQAPSPNSHRGATSHRTPASHRAPASHRRTR
jgi:putative flippase GtrA